MAKKTQLLVSRGKCRSELSTRSLKRCLNDASVSESGLGSVRFGGYDPVGLRNAPSEQKDQVELVKNAMNGSIVSLSLLKPGMTLHRNAFFSQYSSEEMAIFSRGKHLCIRFPCTDCEVRQGVRIS